MPDALTVRLAVADEETLHLLEDCLTASGGFDSPADDLPPNVYILELSVDDPAPLSTLAKAQQENPASILLATSKRSDPAFLIEAMRLGIRDFFAQPVEREAVMNALARIKQTAAPQEKAARGKNGRIIGVMGAKGGVGVTTVCVNLAAAMQEGSQSASVALMDMNIPYGEIQLFLDIKPKFDMGEIMRNLNRLDALYLMDVLSRHESGLRILPCPSSGDDLQMISPDTVEGVLGMLTDLFELVVVDMGIYLDEVTLKVMELSEATLLVTEQSLTCLTSLKRMVEHVSASQSEQAKKLRAVVNRARPDGDISSRDMEEIAGLKAFHELPLEYETAVEAINNGQTILTMAPKSALAKSLRALAAKFQPEGKGQAKKHGLLGLDSFFGHKRA